MAGTTAGAKVEAGGISGAQQSITHEQANDFNLNLKKEGSLGENAASGSFASSGAISTAGSGGAVTDSVEQSTLKIPAAFDGVKHDSFVSSTTSSLISEPKDSHYTGPFPGPVGSIFESKPAPSAKYTGPFPGPVGSIYDSKPIAQIIGSSSSVGANAASGTSTASGSHYTGPFPGPVGSILDGKPISTVNGADSVKQYSKDEDGTEKSVSIGSFALSQANAASQATASKSKSDFEGTYYGEKSAGDSLVSTQTGAAAGAYSSATSGKENTFGDQTTDLEGALQSSGASAASKNIYAGTPAKSTPLVVVQPTFGKSYSSNHAGASSQSSSAEQKYSAGGSFVAPTVVPAVVDEPKLNTGYSGSHSKNDANYFSHSSNANGKITSNSFEASVAPTVGIVTVKEQPLVAPQAPADVVIVGQVPQKPVFTGSYGAHFGSTNSYGNKIGIGSSYGYQQHVPVGEVVVVEEAPRPQPIPGNDVVIVEETPLVASGAPSAGVVLIEGQPRKPVYPQPHFTTPLTQPSVGELITVEEKPYKPYIGKSRGVVVPVNQPSPVPVGSSCSFCSRLAVSGSSGSSANNYKGSNINYRKNFGVGSSGSYRGISGNFGSSYGGNSNIENSNTGNFGAYNNRFDSANEFGASSHNADSKGSTYGVSNVGLNSAVVNQAAVENSKENKNAAGGFGASLSGDESYSLAVPTAPSTHFGSSGNSRSFVREGGAFHSGVKATELGSSGFNENFGRNLANSASYSSNDQKATQNYFGGSGAVGKVEKTDGLSSSYSKDSIGSSLDGSSASFGNGASSAAFATSGSTSGSINNHGLISGLLNGVASQEGGAKANAAAASGSFSSEGLLSGLLGKVKGLVDAGSGSGGVSGSFSSSHSSASSSAQSSSFAASSSKYKIKFILFWC